MTVRCVLAALAVLTVAGCASAQPQVTITDAARISDDPEDPRNCANTDPLMLTVTDGGKDIAHDRYCEYPEDTSARAFKDRRGHIYVFVVVDRYHGTGPLAQELHIKRVNVDRGTLYDVAVLQMTDLDGGPPPSKESLWKVSYNVHETDSGGLQVVVTYAPGPDARCCAPPEKQVSVRLGP